MGNLISFFQEIFMMKANNNMKVGLSCYKEAKTPVEKPIQKLPAPKELKLSDLMRKSC